MKSPSDLGARARAAIQRACPELTQAQVADQIGMAPDALSRALSGKRNFASIELVRIAYLTRSNLHELITGEADPNQLTFVARHSFDRESRQRYNPGLKDDEAILRDVELVYRQAGELPPSTEVPRSPKKLRAELGVDFVRFFADLVEKHLAIDVVRIPGLSTSYSFTVGARHVIVVPAVGNWFWENWCLAHELAHLCLRHHDAVQVPDQHEREADSFAAELLLPADEMKSAAWIGISADDLAQRVWTFGVSTEALKNRLDSLQMAYSEMIEYWARQTTQKLLRAHLPRLSGVRDEITIRMQEAAVRRFPVELQNAHLSRIASGELGKAGLAWMLDVDEESLEVEMPVAPPLPKLDELEALLGLTAES